MASANSCCSDGASKVWEPGTEQSKLPGAIAAGSECGGAIVEDVGCGIVRYLSQVAWISQVVN